MDYTSSITIEKTSGINLPFDILTPEMTTNSESTYESENTNKDLIDQIILRELKLSITSPQNQNFDFLNEITISIVADGLSELVIAEARDIPEDIGDDLELEVFDNNLKEYIAKESFQLKAETVTDKVISNDIVIEANSKFFVDADLLP
jgi:hypothetical protein